MAYKYKALDLPYSEKSEFNTYRGNYDIAQQNIDFSGLENYIELLSEIHNKELTLNDYFFLRAKALLILGNIKEAFTSLFNKEMISSIVSL